MIGEMSAEGAAFEKIVVTIRVVSESELIL